MTNAAPSRQIWTIGHSTRDLEEFLDLLRAADVKAIADVRRFPGSRRYPHFGRDAMRVTLPDAGFRYDHFPALGGRRSRASEVSPNTAWRVPAFQAYADYALSEEFAEALAKLVTLAESCPTAVMCAEALPWRCHRRLIADQLIVRGWQVFDIISPTEIREHELPEFARVEGQRVTYPGRSE